MSLKIQGFYSIDEIAEFDSGVLSLKFDGQAAGKVGVSQGRANFSVPAGEHTIELSMKRGRQLALDITLLVIIHSSKTGETITTLWLK
jgi:hypothetical protein